MPEQAGIIIDDESSGKSAVDAGTRTDSGTEGRSNEPEILYGFDVHEPATERIDATDSSAPGKKRRGRPPGSRNSPGGTSGGNGTGSNKENKSEGILGSGLSLEGVLYSLHLMGSEFLKCKEMELDKDESKKLADAIAEVNRFYNVKFDPKKVAIFNLAVVTASIYGPMAVSIKRRLDAERGPQPVKQAGPQPVQQPKKQATPQQTNGQVDFSRVSPSDVFGAQDAAI